MLQMKTSALSNDTLLPVLFISSLQLHLVALMHCRCTSKYISTSAAALAPPSNLDKVVLAIKWSLVIPDTALL
jgi:hypothetical protein